MLLTRVLPGGDLEAAMSTQEPKLTSPNTPATNGMTEEELEDYVLKTKVEMSSMENTMANSNYTGMFIYSYFVLTPKKYYWVWRCRRCLVSRNITLLNKKKYLSLLFPSTPGSCCRWRSVDRRNFTFIGEEEGAVTSGCSSSCVYALPEDMTRK